MSELLSLHYLKQSKPFLSSLHLFKKHTPPLACTQCCAWEGCSQSLVQLGTQREAGSRGCLPGCLPRSVLSGSRERAPDISKSCALCLQKPSTPHTSRKPSSKVRELPHRQEYLFPLRLPFPPDPFSHYFVPCPEQKVEGCNPKSPSLRVALQTQLLQELHFENELPGEFQMLSTGLFNLSEGQKY